jgi:vinculin
LNQYPAQPLINTLFFLFSFSDRAAKTSRQVAVTSGNKKLAEILQSSAAQIDSLTPQLISAGRIKMTYPDSKAAEEHLNNLKQQYSDTILRMRTLCDQAIDPVEFIKASEEQMQKHSILCEDAIRTKLPQKMVDNTSSIARLANRVLLVAKQEADNSEDPEFTSNLLNASDKLQNSVPSMVQNAKQVATNIHDPISSSNWRDTNKDVRIYFCSKSINNYHYSKFLAPGQCT